MVLPTAIETNPYTHTFVPSGGEGAYFFSMDGGVPGFTLSATGTLSTNGAPTAGSFPFSITVQDDAVPRNQVTTPFTLEVRPLLRVANSLLLDGRANQAYAQQLSATGGVPPYRWVVDGGMLPNGVSITDGGLLGGAPTAAGMVSFGVTVSDSDVPPQQASRVVSINTILLDLVVLSTATPSLADGRRGTPYSQPLKSYGGNQAGVTWTILPGANALPPGVSLTSAGTAGLLSGTPTMDAGTYSFTVRCRDGSLGDLSRSLSITVY
jgi:hypothetical protein